MAAVVAKLQSAQLLHKSDAGGVMLRIPDASALAQAVDRLLTLGEQLNISVQGVLVEQMLPFDHELLLGLRRDPRFGPVLTLARGGIEAELDPDVTNLLLPATTEQIESSLRFGRLLEGFRGRPGADIPTLAAKIAQLCDWFGEQSLRELEINPLAIRGGDVWALDALITPLENSND